MNRKTVEGAMAGVVGAAIATAVLPRRLRLPGAAVAAGNGWIAGRRGTYDWSRPHGIAAFVLDSSWSIVGTTGGLALTAAQLVFGDAGYRPALSARQNRQVYAGGFRLKREFALTSGQVISNAAGVTGIDGPTVAASRRRRLVDRHEELHVWQQRALGPLYPLLYGSWSAAGALLGVAVSAVRRSDLRRTVMTIAYYDNPFETWAYRNDRYWPPSGADPALAWRARAMAPKTPARSPRAGGTTKDETAVTSGKPR